MSLLMIGVKKIKMDNNTLQHHGVLGMKWGVRRYQNKDGSRTAQGKKQRKAPKKSQDYKNAHSRKKVKSMSDQELRTRINRLQMEKQYAKLNQTKRDAGKKFVKDIIVGSASVTLGFYAKKYMRKGAEYLGKQIIK